MTKIFKFIFGLIMLSVFVAGMGIILIMSAPQVAGLYGTSEMNSMDNGNIIGMI